MDELNYTETHSRLRTRLEIPFVMLCLFAGAAFLTKMCYLSLAFNTIYAENQRRYRSARPLSRPLLRCLSSSRKKLTT